MDCFHVEKAVIYGKKIRACTHKHDNSGSGIIIPEKKIDQIDLIISDITLCEMQPWPTFSTSADMTILLPASLPPFVWKFGKNWSYNSWDTTFFGNGHWPTFQKVRW